MPRKSNLSRLKEKKNKLYNLGLHLNWSFCFYTKCENVYKRHTSLLYTVYTHVYYFYQFNVIELRTNYLCVRTVRVPET